MAPIHHWSSYLCIMRMMTVIMVIYDCDYDDGDYDDDDYDDGDELRQ